MAKEAGRVSPFYSLLDLAYSWYALIHATLDCRVKPGNDC